MFFGRGRELGVTFTTDAVLASAGQTMTLSSLLTITSAASNPTYLILDGLDRNEYTAAATGATGSLSGNGTVASFATTNGDAREVGIVFTYDPSSGHYINATYGALDQMTFTASGSANDIANLSLFGTNNVTQANVWTGNYGLESSGNLTYFGSATIATQSGVAAS